MKSLSDKISKVGDMADDDERGKGVWKDDVKEAVKKLKERSFSNSCDCGFLVEEKKQGRRIIVVDVTDIDEIFGKELI